MTNQEVKDYFAGIALSCLLGKEDVDDDNDFDGDDEDEFPDHAEYIARSAYRYADAMIKVRNKEIENANQHADSK